MAESDWIRPEWPAPAAVRALSTTRLGGVSSGPYASLNLGDHVGDDAERVARNRALLIERAALPEPPRWLRQVHGCEALSADGWRAECEADALVSTRAGEVCAVLTADCLPLLLCDRAGTRVGAVHAGWRGLAAGVIERALERLGAPSAEVLAWLGPAIGPAAFEVGDEVRAVFMRADTAAEAAFERICGRWHANLFTLARLRLARWGLTHIYGGEDCTWSQPQRFFSYRRDGVTGRMASLIWLHPGAEHNDTHHRSVSG
ncbi:MAG: peptidoglycan editing factor PgeF [Chromatiaceae bacterium]|nr:peptidoglycan editing factor PgeF [Chromatiaceae bacterium]